MSNQEFSQIINNYVQQLESLSNAADDQVKEIVQESIEDIIDFESEDPMDRLSLDLIEKIEKHLGCYIEDYYRDYMTDDDFEDIAEIYANWIVEYELVDDYIKFLKWYAKKILTYDE